MLNFKNLKIRNKLIAAFSLILLFVVEGWAACQGMTQIVFPGGNRRKTPARKRTG